MSSRVQVVFHSCYSSLLLACLSVCLSASLSAWPSDSNACLRSCCLDPFFRSGESLDFFLATLLSSSRMFPYLSCSFCKPWLSVDSCPARMYERTDIHLDTWLYIHIFPCVRMSSTRSDNLSVCPPVRLPFHHSSYLPYGLTHCLSIYLYARILLSRTLSVCMYHRIDLALYPCLREAHVRAYCASWLFSCLVPFVPLPSFPYGCLSISLFELRPRYVPTHNQTTN